MSVSSECSSTPTATTTRTLVETTQVISTNTAVTFIPPSTTVFTTSTCIVQGIIDCVSSGVLTTTSIIPGSLTTTEVLITDELIQTHFQADVLFGTTCSAVTTMPVGGGPTTSGGGNGQSSLSWSTPSPVTASTTKTLDNGSLSIGFTTSQPPPSSVWVPVVQTDVARPHSSRIGPILGGALGAAFGFTILFAVFWFLRRRRSWEEATEKSVMRDRFSLDIDDRASKLGRRTSAGAVSSSDETAASQMPPTPTPSTTLHSHTRSSYSHSTHNHHHNQEKEGYAEEAPMPEPYAASETHSSRRSVLPRSNPSIRINFERRTSKATSQSDHSHFHSSEASHLAPTSPISPTSTSFPSSPQYSFLPSSSSQALAHFDASPTLSEQPPIPSRSGSPTSFRDLPLGGLSLLPPDADTNRWKLMVTNATPASSFADEDGGGYFALAHGSTTSLGESTPRNPFSDCNAISEGEEELDDTGSPMSRETSLKPGSSRSQTPGSPHSATDEVSNASPSIPIGSLAADNTSHSSRNDPAG